MIRLSPEDSLQILTCRPHLRPQDEAAIIRLAASKVRWEYVLWRAENNRTLTTLEYHLRRLGLIADLPAEISRYLRLWASMSRLRTVQQYRALAEILDAFETAGIANFLLKGADLALLYYPDPLLRTMQDVDLMVHVSDAVEIRRIMFDLGFRHGIFNPSTGEWTDVPHDITAQSLRDTYELPVFVRVDRLQSPFLASALPAAIRYKHVKCHIDSAQNMQLPIFADLHINLSVGIDVDDVWTGVHLAKLLGRTARVQSVTGALWFLAARLYHEAFLYNTLRLVMFGDIHTLLYRHKGEVDWAEIVAIGYKYEMRPALYYVLAIMQKLTDVGVPAEVLRVLQPNSQEIPLQHDWGDILPKLLSLPHIDEVVLA